MLAEFPVALSRSRLSASTHCRTAHPEASEREDSHVAVRRSQALHVVGVACGDHSRVVLESSGYDEGIPRVA